MATWTLLIYIYAGALAKGDSVAMQTITGWKTEQSCKQAGEQAKQLVRGSAKELRYSCFNSGV